MTFEPDRYPDCFDGTDDPMCPVCHSAMIEESGEVGEDQWGRTEYAWWWQCHNCGHSINGGELSRREYFGEDGD
jgi:hypothetical protein